MHVVVDDVAGCAVVYGVNYVVVACRVIVNFISYPPLPWFLGLTIILVTVQIGCSSTVAYKLALANIQGYTVRTRKMNK